MWKWTVGAARAGWIISFCKAWKSADGIVVGFLANSTVICLAMVLWLAMNSAGVAFGLNGEWIVF